MNKVIKIIFIFFTVSFILEAQLTVLRTAAQDSKPKYFKREGQDYITGICVDILRAIESVDKELAFVGDQEFMPFKRIEFELEKGNLDCFAGFIKNLDREKKFTYVYIPIYMTPNILVSRASDEIEINNLEEIKDLEDNLIIMSTGVAQGKALKAEGYNIDDRGRNMNANIKKLLAGRGRFIYQSEVEILSAAKEEKAYEFIKTQPIETIKNGRYIAFSKDVPSDIIKRVEEALKKLKKEGILDEIYRKYI